ncbi:hypothetical protein BOTBODRAFT_448801 [Botryobasidium botryosum FD-172 SS1]|uniref:Secreted protein n=1 Tax=Botryobasidium botryosum (strain FD-172 SS1) TaxID=930990 RepID=A0A067M7X8_BOTB1|nr:hypothetical protein BOTBODRAFT_448801 [Botryobasidium botryosum FD-172 SS1]
MMLSTFILASACTSFLLSPPRSCGVCQCSSKGVEVEYAQAAETICCTIWSISAGPRWALLARSVSVPLLYPVSSWNLLVHSTEAGRRLLAYPTAGLLTSNSAVLCRKVPAWLGQQRERVVLAES